VGQEQVKRQKENDLKGALQCTLRAMKHIEQVESSMVSQT